MLEIREVSKRYGGKAALDSVSLTLKQGVYGLLGPNGAGKSTLMKIITDSLAPSSGAVLWDGVPIGELGERYRAVLGYMPQQQGLYDEFTGRRFLSYLATLKNVPRKQIQEETERTAQMVNMADLLDRPIGTYSGGMKQRVLMAQAIMGDPKLLIFDEPTAGLDPMERVRTRSFIEKLAETRIVLLATHVVSDIETIAGNLILLRGGKVLENASPQELIQTHAPGKGLEDVYLKIFGENAGEQPCA